MAESLWKRGVSGERALVALGILLLVGEALHYGSQVSYLLDRPSHMPQGIPVAALACACHISTIVIALAFILRSPRLGTYGIVLWAFYPMQALLLDVFTGHMKDDWLRTGLPLMQLAGPVCLLVGLWAKRELLTAVGAAFLFFFVKGVINQVFGQPELQVTLMKLIGERTVHEHFMTINFIGLAVGVMVMAAAVMLRRSSSG